MSGKLQIRLFGDFQLLYAEAVVAGVDSPRLQSLLSYLLLHRGAPLARPQVAYLLWPDSSDSQARANLRGLLLRLRRLLPQADACIQRDGSHIQWQPTIPYSLDVADFERYLAAAQTARQSGHEEDFETAATQAAAIYRGDLLPNCYDDWIIPIRERLREGVIFCLAGLAETAERAHRYEVAYSHYLALTHHNPLWEAAYRGVMRALAGRGRLPEAITAYNQLRQVLAEEMDVAPTAETQHLADRLHEELAIKTAVQREEIAKRPPFVGRVKERALLLDRLDRLPDKLATGRGDLILALGEAGMGKTRLLEEAAQAAAWRGWPVAWGRSQEFTLPQAYAPLTQALNAALPRSRIQQLARLAPAPVLATVAPLVPAVREILEATEIPPAPSLAAAIGQLWHALQTISPHLFILEDVQWADPAIWPLLDELRQCLAETAVLLIVSGRLHELKQQETAWTTLRRWDQAGHPFILLDGLSAAELGALSQAAGWGQLDAAKEEELRQASGGNPLLALSLLEMGDWRDSLSAPSLAGQVGRRLADLSTGANEALQAAAVIGYQFDYDLWEGVAGLDPAQLLALAVEMEQAGLIRLAKDGYRFAHDTLRACVYTETPPPRRQTLHGRALSLLAARQPHDPFALLHHAEQAGDNAATLHAAAEMFRGLGDLFREAMALNNLGTAYWSPGDYPQARTTHERALAVNRSLGHKRGEADNLDNLGAWPGYWAIMKRPSPFITMRSSCAARWKIAGAWPLAWATWAAPAAFKAGWMRRWIILPRRSS